MTLTKNHSGLSRASAKQPIRTHGEAGKQSPVAVKTSRKAPDFDKIGADICRRYPKLLKALADN